MSRANFRKQIQVILQAIYTAFVYFSAVSSDSIQKVNFFLTVYGGLPFFILQKSNLNSSLVIDIFVSFDLSMVRHLLFRSWNIYFSMTFW